MGTTSAGALNTRGGKNWRFSTDYYGKLIGSHGCRIEWYNYDDLE